MAWNSCCQDIKEGGLGIKFLRAINEANNLVQCWCIMNEMDSRTAIINARVFMNGKVRKSHVFSSIWTGCKEVFSYLMEHSIWTIGKGDKINLWHDNWCSQTLASLLHIPVDRLPMLKTGINSILCGNSFFLSNDLIRRCLALPNLISSINVNCHNEDMLIWMRSESGEISIKEAYIHSQVHGPGSVWGNIY